VAALVFPASGLERRVPGAVVILRRLYAECLDTPESVSDGSFSGHCTAFPEHGS
jgi:hypothetical protein